MNHAVNGEGGRVVFKRKWKRDEVIWGYVFIAPIVVGLLLFLAFPAVYAIIVSFSEHGTFGDHVKFVGVQNYAKAFKDAYFWAERGTFVLQRARRSRRNHRRAGSNDSDSPIQTRQRIQDRHFPAHRHWFGRHHFYVALDV